MGALIQPSATEHNPAPTPKTLCRSGHFFLLHHQDWGMKNSIGCYRVRPFVKAEHSSPDDVAGPLFQRRDEAETYAQSLVRSFEQPMILEKLAPAGCWLPLETLG
jgi:hypothetical protein